MSSIFNRRFKSDNACRNVYPVQTNSSSNSLLVVMKPKKKKRSKHFIRCCVPYCKGNARHQKSHAFSKHVPGIFDESLRADDQQVLHGRTTALKQAASRILKRPATMNDLLTYLQSKFIHTEITPVQISAMENMCRYLNALCPKRFTFAPIVSPGSLIHWKVVLTISACLDEEYAQYWFDRYTAPTPITDDKFLDQQNFPRAFDSHFHLDRTLQFLSLPPTGSLENILAITPVDGAKRVNLIGTVAVFCDPKTHPTQRSLLGIPKNMYVVVGIHPKHAKMNDHILDEYLESLWRLAQNPRVIGIGEVGIDHTEKRKYWAHQLDLVERILPMIEDRHVLVITCKGMVGDCATEAYLLLLHTLKQKLQINQVIHLHCYTGNQYVVKQWRLVFPRTYFGFTTVAEKFNGEQIMALRSIDENFLLLETAAPHHSPQDQEWSIQSQMLDTAYCVAKHLGKSATEILEITVSNSQYLYGGQWH